MLYILTIVLTVLLASNAEAEAEECDRGRYKKVGCFKVDRKLVSDLLITDLDPTHHKWGQDIDWENFHTSIRSLACRCESKARNNYRYFAIGYYGECWAGSNMKELKETIENPGSHVSTKCVKGKFVKCGEEDKTECAGVEDNEYIYEISSGTRPSPELIKDLVGNWIAKYNSTEGKVDFQVLSDGNIWYKLQNRKVPLKSSDNDAFFPTSEGWLMTKDTYGLKSWEYLRLLEDGTIEIQSFSEDYPSKEIIYKGALKHYCCSAIATRTDKAEWGQWGDYGSCSKTCGQGVQSRSRTCLHKRKDCVGNKEQTRSCQLKKCSGTTQYITLVNKYPQNAMVSSFCPAGSSYSRHVCGSGARTWRGKRSVQYGPFTTDKFLSDKRPGHCGCCCDCNSVTVECRKHSSAAIWGQWSAYSSCSKSCGQGVHKRTRTCLHGRTDCVGEKEETKSCKVKICEYTTHYITLVNKYPQNAMVSSFCPAGSSYSRHVCGSHARTWRGKSSVQYGPFTTDKFLSDKRPGHCGCCCDCNSVTVECRKHSSAAIWGKWSAYSSCSKSCGQGVHKRTRTCLHGRTDCVGQKEETRSCKVKICDYPTRYVTLVNKYPQNAMASSLCPVGYLLSRHVCGQGARTWRGKGSVQYGPFTTDKFLSDKRPGHCGCCCDCNSVTLECRK